MERTWKADYEKFARTARENVAATLDNMDYPALERAAELILAAKAAGKRLHISGIGKPAHLAGYAASLFSSTGTPAAMPSSTAPMALPWLSPKMVSERSLPKVFFMAYSSTPSRGRRPSTGMVSARQQPRPGTLMTVIWPPWAFLSCSISASTFSLL